MYYWSVSEARLGAVTLDREKASDETSLQKLLLFDAAGSLKARKSSLAGAATLVLERSIRGEAKAGERNQLGPRAVPSSEMERARSSTARRLRVCERRVERMAAGVKLE
ncbi:hypothetical protein BWQ96_06077 [Gracilariopsis chorda]|uniref:Uncharacterized protein n=1 Tax=Gracilariopsis chorda TaxID=448386 RepID=A0A2V3IQ20_9FLOR|nr:hypothetical protein BWQ96_06077 [Gracilariopsis chorda]|eukprot:PXF44168.1 hypothetical protein BWQ96_06077 [Gracilariopsis chorda]